jgi:hypothetical protein
MNDKQTLLTALHELFGRWEAVLAGLTEAELTAPYLPAALSVRDVIGHLRAWQQISIARLEAALLNHAPELPGWLAGLPPDEEAYLDQHNARIYQIYHDQAWASVHVVWQAGFQHFLALAAALPEETLFETGRYAWLDGYPLAAVLEGSFEHHQEHLEELLEYLRQQRK